MASETVKRFCHLCAPYCGIAVEVDGDHVVSVRGDRDHATSRGYVCPKGRALGDLHHDPRRLDRPQLRSGGELADVSWDHALDDLAQRLETVVETFGPDAVAMYQGTPALHETVAQPALGKLFHKLGSTSRYTSLTVDIAAKLVVTPLVLGTQLLPVIDVDETRLLVLVGTNPVVSHGQYNGISDPVTRLREIADRGEVWVIDPRRTESAAHATHSVRIRPGTDHALLAFLVRDALRRGVDPDVAERLDGLAELRVAVEPWSIERTAAATDIPTETLSELSAAVARAGRFSLLTGTGVTMAPSANVSEWLALALMLLTDSFDRPGGMWCNPGYTFPRDRGASLPPMAPSDGRPGPASRPDLPRVLAEHPCAALGSEIEAGNVRALISFGGNPLIAIAQPDRLQTAIDSLDAFAVIGTMRDGQTDLATHVLPAADGLERSELLLTSQTAQLRAAAQYAPAVVAPKADRRPAWWIVGQLARRLGHDVLPGRLDVETATEDDLLAVMVGGTDVLAEMKAADGPMVRDDRTFGWALDALPIDRPRLAPPALVEQLASLAGQSSTTEQLRLIPRRRLRRFNSIASERGRSDDEEVLVHPSTADAVGLSSGARVHVASSNGAIVGTLSTTDDIDPGAVAISHGFPDANVGNLTSTSDEVDPLSGQIAQTAIPVRLGPA